MIIVVTFWIARRWALLIKVQEINGQIKRHSWAAHPSDRGAFHIFLQKWERLHTKEPLCILCNWRNGRLFSWEKHFSNGLIIKWACFFCWIWEMLGKYSFVLCLPLLEGMRVQESRWWQRCGRRLSPECLKWTETTSACGIPQQWIPLPAYVHFIHFKMN